MCSFPEAPFLFVNCEFLGGFDINETNADMFYCWGGIFPQGPMIYIYSWDVSKSQ